MIRIHVQVTMHGPFRVSTGVAAHGLDAVVDPERIPASSLKGVMRAAAVEILGIGPERLTRIFGGGGDASPWAWNDLRLPEDRQITTRVRIPIESESGAAAKGGLFHAQEAWVAQPVNFEIEQVAATTDPAADALILAAAARAVKGLGASRRRGLGWTTWEPLIDEADTSLDSLVAAVQAARESVA